LNRTLIKVLIHLDNLSLDLGITQCNPVKDLKKKLEKSKSQIRLMYAHVILAMETAGRDVNIAVGWVGPTVSGAMGQGGRMMGLVTLAMEWEGIDAHGVLETVTWIAKYVVESVTFICTWN
jgi:hypothetical protein